MSAKFPIGGGGGGGGGGGYDHLADSLLKPNYSIALFPCPR